MADINSYRPQSGRVIGEDNKTYNVVDLLQNVGGSNMNPDDYYTKKESDGKYQPKGDYATSQDIPSDNSQLDNGAGYITGSYDNSNSGLTATDIQAAIDELKSLIDGLNSGGA